MALVTEAQKLQLLRAVATAANEAPGVDDILGKTVDLVCDATGWPLGHVCLPDSNGVMVSAGIWSEDATGRFEDFRRLTGIVSFPLGVGLPGRVLLSGKPAWISDFTEDGNFPRIKGVQAAGLNSGFAFPVPVDGKVGAVLEFFSPEPQEPDPQVLETMGDVGRQIGHVMERDQALRTVREAEERTRSLIDTATDAFVSMDVGGRITDWNRQAEAIFGWPRQEVLGRILAETIIPERYREMHNRGLQHFLESGEGPVLGQRLELAALHQSGREFPIELTIWVPPGADYRFFNAFIRDISERKSAEDVLKQSLVREREMVAKLKELDVLKSDLVSSVSHELRTPLTSILGYLELLMSEEDEGLTDAQMEMLEVVNRNSKRLLGLIEDLLTLSRIESGSFRLDLAPVGLAGIVEAARQLVFGAIPEVAPNLRVDIANDVKDVIADEIQLEKVLTNLLGNAIKFSPEGGEIRLWAKKSGEFVELGLSDSGIGIPTDEQHNLFNPFFRSSVANERSIQGTGLGLAIVKTIIEQHGGSIAIDSEEGKGTTVTFTIPSAG